MIKIKQSELINIYIAGKHIQQSLQKLVYKIKNKNIISACRHFWCLMSFIYDDIKKSILDWHIIAIILFSSMASKPIIEQ